MKKIKLLLIVCLISICFTGCFKTDDMEDIDIITTNYAIEYATKRLYGENSTISNIYPRGIVKDKYKLTNKQIKDYSKNDLFIYDGNTNDKDIVLKMLDYRNGLKIIDATYGVATESPKTDAWLNLADYLMLIQNIKNELQDYITDKYLAEKIDDRYDLLKIDITSLDAMLTEASNNSLSKYIISYDDTLNYLTRYEFEVINLTQDGKEKEVNIDNAVDLINNKKVSYIFVPDTVEKNDLIDKFTSEYGLKMATFKTLESISEKDFNNNEDFLTIMQSNINLITQETYE